MHQGAGWFFCAAAAGANHQSGLCLRALASQWQTSTTWKHRMTQTNPPIVLDAAARRFEIHVNGGVAYAEFEPFAGGIAILHTVVPKALEGQGLGGRLVRHALDHALQHGLKIRPDCSFVKAYIDRHPQYQPHVVPE
jgi:predicted GNAT family acetyltransferase